MEFAAGLLPWNHVDNRYKHSLITTMLDRAYRISSDWSYFSQECDRLETVFLKLFNLAVKQFVDSKGSNKFDCLIKEMLFIRKLKPSLNVQADSIRAKVFT